MNLTVNVFEYRIQENTEYPKNIYVKETGKPINGVYVTLRRSDGTCESKQTIDGTVTFNNVTTGDIVYETLENISGNKEDAYFDNLVVKQPVIGDSDIDPFKAVTSTTRRKYIVTGTQDTTVEFGHCVYKPIRCHIKQYLNVVENYNTKLYDIDIIGSHKENGKDCANHNKIINYTNVQLNSLGYNYEEGLLYGTRFIEDAYKGNIYRIDGDNKIVKLDEIKGISITTRICIGDFDDKGNYLISERIDDSLNGLYTYICYRINFNPNSLNYLYAKEIAIEPGNTGGRKIKYLIMADWKYKHDTKELYSIAINKDQNYGREMVLVKFQVDLKNNTLNLNAENIDKTDIKMHNGTGELMVGCYAYGNNKVYFIADVGEIYMVDINKPQKKLEHIKSLNSTYKQMNGDAANCSRAFYRFDFGNAPETDVLETASYKTTLSNNGPRHGVCPDIRIGEVVYPEEDATMGESANDNDGCKLPLPTVSTSSDIYSLNVKCYNNTGYLAKLYGWLDFNTDGIFSIDEFASVDVPSMDRYQTVTLNFNRKGAMPTDGRKKTFIRLRLASEELEGGTVSDQAYSGHDPRSLTGVKYKVNPSDTEEKYTMPAIDGEVEDWSVNIDKVPYIVCDKTADKDISSRIVVSSRETITYTVTVKNHSTVDANNLVVKDDLDVLSSDVEFVSAKYVDANGQEHLGITKDELQTGVSIDKLGYNQTVIFTIIVKVK